MKKQPRGIRNNNPGNIDYTPTNKWEGQLPHDPAEEPRFCRFDTPENGIRASGKLLVNYQKKYNRRSVERIIRRWAPDNENNTAAYVKHVSAYVKQASYDPDNLELTDPNQLEIMIRAIIVHENGSCPYTDAVIQEGVRRALL